MEQDEIAFLGQLLGRHRTNLRHLLVQATRHGGEALAPLYVANTIREERAAVARLKAQLRAAGIAVKDQFEDEQPSSAPLPAGDHGAGPATAGGVSLSGAGTQIVGDVRDSHITTIIGETPELRERRLAESLGVLRDELLRNLQALASQIDFTLLGVTGQPTLPRRPGETLQRFEDRARDEFGHEIAYFFSQYGQFALSSDVYASQRTNVAALAERDRLAVTRAYEALDEARKRVALYRDFLQELLRDRSNTSAFRQVQTELLRLQAANHLTSEWFEVLGNWLLLEPDDTALQIAQQALPPLLKGEPAQPLQRGVEGWHYAKQQRARLSSERVQGLEAELRQREAARAREAASAEQPAADVADALTKAALAYMEGDPAQSVRFLEEAARFPDIAADQRRYIDTSLAYLHDPDAFGGALGVYLTRVDAAGTAGQAGLQTGDVILRYNGEPVQEPQQLAALIARAPADAHVSLEIVRDNHRLTRSIRGGASLQAVGTTLVYLHAHAV